MSLYKTYLQFSKPVLVNFLRSIGVSLEFKTIQSAASFLNRYRDERTLASLKKFSQRYLAENFYSLSLPEMKAFFRFSKINNLEINDEKDILKNARKWMSRKYQDKRLEKENQFKQKYVEFDKKIEEENQKKINEALKPFSDIYTDLPVSEKFNEKVIELENEKKIRIRINLNQSREMVQNMVNFISNRILRFMNFSDILKICFITNDGSHHYEYFNVDSIKYLFEKFSNENWDKITEEICPSEGSDKLILHMDYKRITFIEFTLYKNSIDNDGYKTRGGSFFKYLVKSKTDLVKFQIFKELNEKTAKLMDDHCLIYALKQAHVDNERICRAKEIINPCNFKIKDLEELGSIFNIQFNVKFYNHDNDYKQISNFNTYSYPENKLKNPVKIINLIVIDDHYMIDEKVKFNKRYFENKEAIKSFINDLRLTNPNKANKYFENRYLFKKFKGKYIEFFNEDNLPEFSIFEVLQTLKNAGKFREISVSDYWSLYGSIRKNNLAKIEEIREPNEFETNLYKPFPIDLEKVLKSPHKQEYLVFADFEASTDGKYHKPYCICARKYSVDVFTELNRISEKNIVTNNKYEISEEFESFSSYSKDCAVEFFEWLDSNSVVFFHNLTYDITFLLKHVTTFISSLIFHGRDMNHRVMYKDKFITFKDSLCMINTKLSNFPGMFKLDCGEKEAFPYDYYSSTNAFNKYGNIKDALNCKHFNDHKDLKPQFIVNINKIEGIKIDENRFDMEKYALFYCEQDVRILSEGLIKFNQMCREGLEIDCLNAISISGLANKYFQNHVYFKNHKIYQVGGNLRNFMMKTIYGGRCMVRDNNMFALNEKLCDFDAVSLYPSAIKRSYILEGIPEKIPDNWTKEYLMEHLFDDDQIKPTKEKFISGFFAKIKITKVNKKLHMPLIFNKPENSDENDDSKPLCSNECCVMYVNHITLQDLIRFQEIEYDLLGGYYYHDNRDLKCQEVIQYLFEKRKEFKSQKNPVEQIFKLVMNSVYGKTIMKPINSKTKIIKKNDFKKFKAKNYNHIKSYDELEGGNAYQVKTIESLIKDYNLAHFGSIILSMSKRIISEVFCLAEDLGHEIYYTDTDSGHFRESEINELASEFKKKYGRDLIGTDLGQFHCDFENISNDASMPISVKSIFLGKKAYIDMLQDDKGNIAFHARMKGIPACVIQYRANELFPKSIPVKLNGGLFKPKINMGIEASYSIFELYKHLFNRNLVKFDLLSGGNCSFGKNKDRSMYSVKEFTRNIEFAKKFPDQQQINNLF